MVMNIFKNIVKYVLKGNEKFKKFYLLKLNDNLQYVFMKWFGFERFFDVSGFEAASW